MGTKMAPTYATVMGYYEKKLYVKYKKNKQTVEPRRQINSIF